VRLNGALFGDGSNFDFTRAWLWGRTVTPEPSAMRRHSGYPPVGASDVGCGRQPTSPRRH
jgi:hypothetical protein